MKKPFSKNAKSCDLLAMDVESHKVCSGSNSLCYMRRGIHRFLTAHRNESFGLEIINRFLQDPEARKIAEESKSKCSIMPSKINHTKNTAYSLKVTQPVSTQNKALFLTFFPLKTGK